MGKPRNPRDRIESQLTRVVADIDRLKAVKSNAEKDLNGEVICPNCHRIEHETARH